MLPAPRRNQESAALIDFILLTVVILAGAAGDVSLTRGMKAVGEISGFRSAILFAVAGKVVRNRFIWLGVLYMTVAFFSFLALLVRADLSWVVPATAVSYVVETLAAKYLLSEKVTRTRWAGALCVCLGVALISL